jgi:acyl dehydratase
MALDASVIGKTLTGASLLITRSRLQLFAKAIGQTDPVFIDVEAARAAGYPDLPVPPTFFLAVDLEAPDPFGYLDDLDIDIRTVLHGEQSFEYHSTAHAGDELFSSSVLTDVFEKKGGALTFLVIETPIVNKDGARIVTMKNTIVVRELEGVTS